MLELVCRYCYHKGIYVENTISNELIQDYFHRYRTWNSQKPQAQKKYIQDHSYKKNVRTWWQKFHSWTPRDGMIQLKTNESLYNLRYTWGCEGLWTPQYPPNQPRVIHDWFPKDWIRFWIYHQNNQPDFFEIQVHFVPYPDPYPFHTRSVPESCHVGSIPHHHHFLIFKCIQHIIHIPHPLYVAAMPLMKS